MKFRQQKKKFYHTYGKIATIFANEQTKMKPVAEFLNKNTGQPIYLLLTQATAPVIGEKWVITFNRDKTVSALYPFKPKAISSRKVARILAELSQLFR